MSRLTSTRAVSPRANAPARGFAPAPGYNPPETIAPNMARLGDGRDAVERLPVEAREKYLTLIQMAQDAVVLARAAGEKRSEAIERKNEADQLLSRHEATLSRAIGRTRDEHGNTVFDTDPQWRTLKAAADRATEKYERAARLSDERGALFYARKGAADNLEKWLERQDAETTFEPVETKPATVKRGENIVDVVEAIRADIAARKVEAERLKNAPPSKDEARAAAARYVERMIAEGAPKLRDVAAPGVASHVTWATRQADVLAFVHREGGAVVADPSPPRVRTVDPVALVAWLDPDTFRTRIMAEVDEQFSDDQLDAKGKVERLATIAGEILQLERVEEATISEAEATGVEILRRVDAAPPAVLQIAIS